MITKTLAALLLAAVAGCAGLRNVSSDVSSFGDWPVARAPGSYAFERLPSQAAQAEETGKLEAAAGAALEKAGFRPAAPGATPDVLVQVGSRTQRQQQSLLWDDPLWWRGGFGSWRYGAWGGARWGGYGGWYGNRPSYDREIALLLRDTASGRPLFESHATSEGGWGGDSQTLQAMFEAALVDFPRLGVNPRRVVVALPPKG